MNMKMSFDLDLVKIPSADECSIMFYGLIFEYSHNEVIQIV